MTISEIPHGGLEDVAREGPFPPIQEWCEKPLLWNAQSILENPNSRFMDSFPLSRGKERQGHCMQKRSCKARDSATGFTLIELLVVMSIVALLLTIALPRYFGSLEKSKEVALKENLQVLRVTLDKFYADKGRYPETLDELAEQKYLRKVPVDPITEMNNSWILVMSEDSDRKGIADVKSGAPGVSKEGKPYESF